MQELYTTQFLLDRIYENLGNKKNNKKFTIKKPEYAMQNKKIYIINFTELCNAIKRNRDSVKKYIESELNILSSITGEGEKLMLNGTPKPDQITKIISAYIKKYVICSEPKCGSGETEIIKENRSVYLKCNMCKSKKYLD